MTTDTRTFWEKWEDARHTPCHIVAQIAVTFLIPVIGNILVALAFNSMKANKERRRFQKAQLAYMERLVRGG